MEHQAETHIEISFEGFEEEILGCVAVGHHRGQAGDQEHRATRPHGAAAPREPEDLLRVRLRKDAVLVLLRVAVPVKLGAHRRSVGRASGDGEHATEAEGRGLEACAIATEGAAILLRRILLERHRPIQNLRAHPPPVVGYRQDGGAVLGEYQAYVDTRRPGVDGVVDQVRERNRELIAGPTQELGDRLGIGMRVSRARQAAAAPGQQGSIEGHVFGLSLGSW